MLFLFKKTFFSEKQKTMFFCFLSISFGQFSGGVPPVTPPRDPDLEQSKNFGASLKKKDGKNKEKAWEKCARGPSGPLPCTGKFT